MAKIMNKKILIASLFVSLALLLFGCGGQTEQATETTTETSTEAAESATTTITITETADEEEPMEETEATDSAADTTTETTTEEETDTETAPETEEETAAEAASQTVEVDIQNYAFDEKTITINAGDTVVWENYDSAPHTVTATSGADFDSGKMSKGDTWSYIFTEPGTYEYYCTYHPSMKAKVIVE